MNFLYGLFIYVAQVIAFYSPHVALIYVCLQKQERKNGEGLRSSDSNLALDEGPCMTQ